MTGNVKILKKVANSPGKKFQFFIQQNFYTILLFVGNFWFPRSTYRPYRIMIQSES
jgi:hypothetical protein